MKGRVQLAVMLLGAVFVFFITSSWSGASYADQITAKTNFKPSTRSMSFVKFMNAPENHGIRDMRSLKRRYARYRSGQIVVADTERSDHRDSGVKQ